MIPLLENLFTLPVPEDVTQVFVDESEEGTQYLRVILGVSIGIHREDTYALPPGNWQLIGTTKDCTEEQAREIVEVDEFGYMFYRNYLKPEEPFDEATESLSSLLRSKDLDTANNYAFFKKVTQ